jgi:hypothetical protein
MHASLRPRTNIWLLAVWGGIAAAVIAVAHPVPWPFIAAGRATGFLLGVLQLKVLRASFRPLLASQTSMDVRRALGSSRLGRLYLWLFWGAGVALLSVAAHVFRERAFIAFVGAYATFAFVRELVSLPATFELQRLSAESAEKEERAI